MKRVIDGVVLDDLNWDDLEMMRKQSHKRLNTYERQIAEFRDQVKVLERLTRYETDDLDLINEQMNEIEKDNDSK